MTGVGPADLEIAVGLLAGLVLAFALAMVVRRQPAADGEVRLSRVETQQTDMAHDIRNIRAAIGALPSKESVHRLEVEMTELKGRLAVVDASTTSTGRAVDRIESLLLSEKRPAS